MKIWLLITAGMVAFALTACASSITETQQAPPTAFPTTAPTLEPCVVPTCWEGIVVGSTTLAEAQNHLKVLYGEDNVLMTTRGLDWRTNSEQIYAQGHLENDGQGFVRRIEVYFREGTFRTDALLDQFGEPESVWVARAFSFDALCTGGALLNFLNNSLSVRLYPVDSINGVYRTQSVYYFWITPEDTNWSITDHFRFAWQGYTNYCDIRATQVAPG